MKLTIATPMYGGQCSGIFTKSLIVAIPKLAAVGIEVDFIDLYNESLITRARNTLTQMFLNSKSDYLLFIDADQSFRADDIVRMIRFEKDIIAAPVPMKGINWGNVKKAALDGKENLSDYTGIFNVNILPESIDESGSIKVDSPLEVLHAGTGMMMISRKVFGTLSDLVDEYRYDGTPMPEINIVNSTMIKNFWETKVVDGRLLSEDYNFCSLWRSTGGKVYVDLLSRVVHLGTYTFAGNLLANSKPQQAEELKQPAKKRKAAK